MPHKKTSLQQRTTMIFQSTVTSFLFISLQLISSTDCKIIKQNYPDVQQGNVPSPHMSLVEFQSMLYSEVNSEIEVLQQQDSRDSTPHHQDHRLRGRYLREEDVIAMAQEVWDDVVQHGWGMAQLSHKSYQKRHSRNRNLQEETSDPSPMISPFLVCSHTSQEKSGYQRLQAMLDFSGAHLGDYTIVRNDPDKTCFHVSLEYEAAQKAKRESMKLVTDSSNNGHDYFTLVPMADLMKIQFETMHYSF